jgi:hypothetical protein
LDFPAQEWFSGRQRHYGMSGQPQSAGIQKGEQQTASTNSVVFLTLPRHSSLEPAASGVGRNMARATR